MYAIFFMPMFLLGGQRAMVMYMQLAVLCVSSCSLSLTSFCTFSRSLRLCLSFLMAFCTSCRGKKSV